MIIRTTKDRNFSVINNTVLRDERLSWRARGLAAYLLTQPDDWSISSDTLAKQATEGRDAVRAALKELENAGYLHRRKFQDAAGRWSTELELSETPTTDFQSSVDQSSVFRSSVSQALIVNTKDQILLPNTKTKECGAKHRTTPPTPLFSEVDEAEDETPTPEEPPKQKPEPVDEEYFKAVSWVLGRNPETMTKASRLEVTQIVRKFKKQGYTLTQIKNWYLTFWKKDWRGKNGSKPTAKQFVNEFNPLQEKEITDVITSGDTHTEELPELDESVWDTTNLDF